MYRRRYVSSNTPIRESALAQRAQTMAPPRAGVDRSETAATVTSADGTTIGYTTLGVGEAVIVVGGVLRTGFQ
jgi:hypothetical protein